MFPRTARRRAIARALAVLLAACTVQPSWAADTNHTASTGELTIVSTPDAATVYVDGHSVGTTPISVSQLTVGEHRVRLVRTGHLENMRVVSVRADKATHLAVTLTPAQTAAQTQPAAPSAGGESSKKWLWIGLAAGGGAAATALLISRKNDPPSAGTILVSPSATGMAGQTSFTLQATGANDPNGDSLSYTWNFGDSATGTGESVTHTYAAPGTYQVQLSVSDGKSTVNAPNASVVVGPSLAGTWGGGSILLPDSIGRVIVNCGLNLVLTQSGNALSGSMPFSGGCTGSAGSLTSGSASVLSHPTTVSVTSGQFSFGNQSGLVISFSGTTSASGTTLTGNVTLTQPSTGFTQTTATSFTRQ